MRRCFELAEQHAHKRGLDPTTPPKHLGRCGLYYALSAHCGLFPILSDEEAEQKGYPAALDDVCEIVGLPCSFDSFMSVVQHLRLAMLLKYYLHVSHDGKGVFKSHRDKTDDHMDV